MRRNHPRNHQRVFDRDYIDVPELPHIKYFDIKAMKTIYENREAAPGAWKTMVFGYNMDERKQRILDTLMDRL